MALKIDDAGLAVGGPPFRNFTATWDQLAAVEIEPERARLVRKDGKARTFNFADLRNAADVREALAGREAAPARHRGRGRRRPMRMPASQRRRPRRRSRAAAVRVTFRRP